MRFSHSLGCGCGLVIVLERRGHGSYFVSAYYFCMFLLCQSWQPPLLLGGGLLGLMHERKTARFRSQASTICLHALSGIEGLKASARRLFLYGPSLVSAL